MYLLCFWEMFDCVVCEMSGVMGKAQADGIHVMAIFLHSDAGADISFFFGRLSEFYILRYHDDKAHLSLVWPASRIKLLLLTEVGFLSMWVPQFKGYTEMTKCW